MRTAGFCPPLMLPRPTPLSCAILGARRVSTRSSTWESGIDFELTAIVSTGASAGFVLLYTGGDGRLAGNRLCDALIADCTSSSATSMFRLRLNCSTMTEVPPELVDVIWLNPCSWPKFRSRGAVTVVDITVGLAPG